MRISDWSSDVCSSDLRIVQGVRAQLQTSGDQLRITAAAIDQAFELVGDIADRFDAGDARATFERVQHAAQFIERLAIMCVAFEYRVAVIEGFEQFVGFADENVEQLRIDTLLGHRSEEHTSE